ncbi:MAG: beta-ketoacyl synthase chain length factor [Bacteroidota bacterium]
MDVFINSAEAITPQNTFDTKEFLTNINELKEDYFTCIRPDYKEYISPKLLRRMSKVVRMGIASSKMALQTANIEQPDAIIVGTGMGCLDDTVKFLDQIIENNESLLNPTPFIQSTHNTVSGQIALLLGCKNYNFTFTQQDVSFETALVDTFLILQEKKGSNILLGGIDEVTEKTYRLQEKAGCTKVPTDNILKSNTKGYIPGEGSCFFTLSNQESDKNIAKVTAISVFNKIDDRNTLPKDLQEILSENNISINDIDILISGVNGDVSEDKNYASIQQIFKESLHVGYKNLIGEYDTASSFAMWLGTKIIQNQLIPNAVKINSISKKSIETVLIHSYSKGHEHSFTLLSKC